MLARFADLLQLTAAGSAIGAFTCYDATTASAVVSAAEQHGKPLIILVTESSLRSPSGRYLLPALVAIGRSSSAHVCLQLDHAHDERIVRQALAAGVGAVLADGASLPLDENVAWVRLVAGLARRAGAGVEAELGYVSGDEDRAGDAGQGELTDPDAVGEFVERTGCDLLAISIGNRHGAADDMPALDFDRLNEIGARTGVPLSLHGGSGVSDDDLRRLIAGGIRKINVNSEIRSRQIGELRHGLEQLSVGSQMLALQNLFAESARKAVGDKLRRFSQED